MEKYFKIEPCVSFIEFETNIYNEVFFLKLSDFFWSVFRLDILYVYRPDLVNVLTCVQTTVQPIVRGSWREDLHTILNPQADTQNQDNRYC